MTTTIRIMSLGEIVSPNLMKGMHELCSIIQKQKTISHPPTDLKQIGEIATSQKTNIDNFKLGIMPEDEFDKAFIASIKEKTGVDLDPKEFTAAWNKMNPEYKNFESYLKEAIEFNTKPNQTLVLISHTNPKDLENLKNELTKNGIPFKLNENKLVEINGIRLECSCYLKKTKSEILLDVINEFKKPKVSSLVANSLLKDLKEDGPVDIKFIYGVNKIQFDKIQKDHEETTKAATEAAKKVGVETILWNKEVQPKLGSVLLSSSPTLLMPAASL